jgi:hypothetical protein
MHTPRSSSSLIALLALVALGPLGTAGCRRATEIIVSVTANGPLPAHYSIKVARAIPFDTTPATWPAFVKQVYLGQKGELYFDVESTTANALISLLPPTAMPVVTGTRDIMVSIEAPGYAVNPPNAQPLKFLDGESQEIRFFLNPVIPDGGVDGGADAGAKDMSGAADLSTTD